MGLLRGIAGLVGVLSSILALLVIFFQKAAESIAQYTKMGVIEFLAIGLSAMALYVVLGDD